MRVKSEENLQLVREMSCCVCGCLPLSDAHHLKTRGAGGGDQLFNLISACRFCHTKIHKEGLKKVAENHKLLKDTLILKGWHYDNIRGKWQRNID